MPLVTVLVVAVLVVYLFSIYNKFQTTKTRIEASIQEIGNQLKRQADLIPNLESSVKSYLKHEKEIFAMLTEARKAITSAVKEGIPQKMVDAATKLQEVLPRLTIAVEDNPELRAQEPVKKLMDELRDTADKLMYARRTLIDLVADFNRMLLTVPSNVVGKIFGFKKREGLKTPTEGEHLKVSPEEMKSPKVKLE
ncbi:LemA family protein [Patescibacteria group bacterium]|nr:LemA family protein [Patescibacteria group bacterium]